MLRSLASFSLLFGLLSTSTQARVCVKGDDGVVVSCAEGVPTKPTNRVPFRDRFFQFSEKAEMQHTFIYNTPVILDTDFISKSINAARVVGRMYEIKDGGHLFAIVKRNGYSAVLIDQGGFNKLRLEAMGLSRCNRAQCTAGIIGGVINGGLTGAEAAVGLYFGPKGALA